MSHIANLLDDAKPLPHLVDLLQRAIMENPPVVIREGGVIADGYDSELDDLRALNSNAGEFLLAMEEREKAATGISTLKSVITGFMDTILKFPVPRVIKPLQNIFVVRPLKMLSAL